MKIENCLLFRKVYFIEQIEMLLDQRYTDHRYLQEFSAQFSKVGTLQKGHRQFSSNYELHTSHGFFGQTFILAQTCSP